MSKLDRVFDRYTPTIGIECHVQLNTLSKLFSSASNDSRDSSPNTTVNEVCFGMPGVLPVLNDGAVERAIRAGLALNAEIPQLSRFERKHYFYPDLPKGYQITQLQEPVIVGGYVKVDMKDGSSQKIRIHHAHLEEDAGKLTHPSGKNVSYVDLNRAGTPLIEIVSEADMHSPSDARAFAQELYLLMTYADVTNGDLYQGNMRFDVNISLAPKGSDELGTRAEIKNINSFRAVEKAAEYECLRQAEILDKSDLVVQETRGWNEDKQKTIAQRSKEDAHDYRYFPDPDLPPLIIEQSRVDSVKQSMPTLPNDYRSSLAELGLDISVVNSLLEDRDRANIVINVLKMSNKEHATRVAHWLVSVYEGRIKELLSTERLISLSMLMSDGELSSTSAKQVLHAMGRDDSSPREIADELGLLQNNDKDELERIISAVLEDPASEKVISDIKNGNDKAIGYLVGQVMKASKGSANPGLVNKIIRSKLF